MRKNILIVIDVQNDFITGSLGNEEAQNKIPNIVKMINDNEWDYIFVTRDTHDSNYLLTKEGKELPVEHCIKGTKGWLIQKDVAEALQKKDVQEKCVVHYIDKPTFGSEELISSIKTLLKHYKSEVNIKIVGFVSSICVISNALMLKAALYDKANIEVNTNCTAGLNKENNQAALEVLKSCQIKIVE